MADDGSKLETSKLADGESVKGSGEVPPSPEENEVRSNNSAPNSADNAKNAEYNTKSHYRQPYVTAVDVDVDENESEISREESDRRAEEGDVIDVAEQKAIETAITVDEGIRKILQAEIVEAKRKYTEVVVQEYRKENERDATLEEAIRNEEDAKTEAENNLVDALEQYRMEETLAIFLTEKADFEIRKGAQKKMQLRAIAKRKSLKEKIEIRNKIIASFTENSTKMLLLSRDDLDQIMTQTNDNLVAKDTEVQDAKKAAETEVDGELAQDRKKRGDLAKERVKAARLNVETMQKIRDTFNQSELRKLIAKTKRAQLDSAQAIRDAAETRDNAIREAEAKLEENTIGVNSKSAKSRKPMSMNDSIQASRDRVMW